MNNAVEKSRNTDEVWIREIKWNSGFGSYSLLPDFYCLLTSSGAAAKPLRTKVEILIKYTPGNKSGITDSGVILYIPASIVC